MYGQVHQPIFLRVFIKCSILLREGTLSPALLKISSFDDGLERLWWGIKTSLKARSRTARLQFVTVQTMGPPSKSLWSVLLPDLLGAAGVGLAPKSRLRFPFNSMLTGVYWIRK